MIKLKLLLIIIEQAFLNFPLVLGSYVSISLMKIPDLSIESAYVFGAIVASQCLTVVSDLPTPLTYMWVFSAAIMGGMLVGLTSSVLTQRAKLPHLLSAILTTGIFHGLNMYVLGTSHMSISKYKNLLGYLTFVKHHPELPSLTIAFSVLTCLGYFFFKTQLGYALAVHGNNSRFFHHYGISTSYVFIAGVLISNGLAGLAGYFDAASGGFVDINMAAVKALFCVTSLILGKTILRPKKPFSIFVPAVGVIAYFCIQQLLLKVGFDLKYFTMIQSLIVLIFLVFVYKKKTGKIDHLGV